MQKKNTKKRPGFNLTRLIKRGLWRSDLKSRQNSSAWKVQMKETSLWEERYILMLKLKSLQNKEEKDICKKRIIQIEESLAEIKKEKEGLEANNPSSLSASALPTKSKPFNSVKVNKKESKKEDWKEDWNKTIDKSFISINNVSPLNMFNKDCESINASKDNIHENFVNKKVEEEKGEKEQEKINLNNGLKDSLEVFDGRRNWLIFFVKFIAASLWLYFVYKFVGDCSLIWKWADIYMHPPLPLEPAPPIWADQFLTLDKLEKMEGVIITGEKLGELVLDEDNRLIWSKTKFFIEGLEKEVGLSVEDKKVINDKITWEERKMLYWLIDVIKELWIKGFEKERALILGRIIRLLQKVKERSKK